MMLRWVQRLVLIVLLLSLVGCGGGKYIKVVTINKYNINKDVVFAFIGTGRGADVDFVLRYDVDYKGVELAVDVDVKFEDGTFYREKVVIPLRDDRQLVGIKKGDVVDLRFRWRTGIGFGVNERVRLSLSPAMEKIDWSGIDYIGVEVSGVEPIKY